jgi:hypothetical protein
MITLFYLVIWWLIGFLIIQTYQKLGVIIIDTNVDSYRFRVKYLFSFLGVINLILIPILRVR